MSATRDSSQKPTFVYSNLYALFRKSREAAQASEAQLSSTFVPPVRGEVLKAQAKEYRPVEFLSARRTRESAPSQPVEDLKKSLHGLKELQSKLKFLLSELETELTPKKGFSDSDE